MCFERVYIFQTVIMYIILDLFYDLSSICRSISRFVYLCPLLFCVYNLQSLILYAISWLFLWVLILWCICLLSKEFIVITALQTKESTCLYKCMNVHNPLLENYVWKYSFIHQEYSMLNVVKSQNSHWNILQKWIVILKISKNLLTKRMSHISLLASGSIPEVGSSNIST